MENKLTPELIEKARQAESPEVILNLAKENGITLTEDEAREYFSELHGQSQKTGELSDDELDNVSGGGCHVKLNGKKYTVVTSCHSCSHYCDRGSEPHCSELRKAWMDYSRRGKCGWCHYLEFKGSTGYCEFSGKYE